MSVTPWLNIVCGSDCECPDTTADSHSAIRPPIMSPSVANSWDPTLSSAAWFYATDGAVARTMANNEMKSRTHLGGLVTVLLLLGSCSGYPCPAVRFLVV